MNLTEALDIFSDNLEDIKQSCFSNIEHIVFNTPAESTGQQRFYIEMIHTMCPSYTIEEIEADFRKYKIEKETEGYKRTVKRIVAMQEVRKPQQNFNRITEADIDRAREYPIEDMLDGRTFKAGGGRISTHCPFHDEKTPSFYVHKDNRWSCFGSCGEHGDAIAFYMKMHNVDFIQAVKVLSGK